MNRRKIMESKDVNIYKQLLDIFGSYVNSFPCTGVDTLFNTLLEGGKKLLPNDPRALMILENILCERSGPDAIQRILNIRFSDLPEPLKPSIKGGKAQESVCWIRDGRISDRVRDLIDFQRCGKKGSWCDTNGDKVTLIAL